MGLLLLIATPMLSQAANLKTLNGLGAQNQFLTTPNSAATNSMHMQINSNGAEHQFVWDGSPWTVAQGGTGATNFNEGGVLFYDGTNFAQSTTPGGSLMWDEEDGRLSIGNPTNDPGFEKLQLFLSGDTTTSDSLGMIIRNHTQSNFGSAIRLEGAGGTEAAPEAVSENMTVGAFVFGGYNGVEFPRTARAQIRGIAEEDWTPTATGLGIAFTTTAPGDTARSEKLRITGDGRIGIGTNDPQANLDVVSNDGDAVVKIDGDTGSCLIMKDSDGDGYTYITANDGALSASTEPCD